MPKTGPDASQWRSRLHQFAFLQPEITSQSTCAAYQHQIKQPSTSPPVVTINPPVRSGQCEPRIKSTISTHHDRPTSSYLSNMCTPPSSNTVTINTVIPTSTVASLSTASALPVVTSSVSLPHGRVLAMVIKKPNLQQQALFPIMHQPSSLSPCVHGLDASSTSPVSGGSSHPSALHQHVSSMDTVSPHGAGIPTDTPMSHQVTNREQTKHLTSPLSPGAHGHITSASVSEMRSQSLTPQQAEHLISPLSVNSRTESSFTLSQAQAPPSKRVCLHGASSSALSLALPSTESEIVPRRPTDYALRLPNGWHGNIASLDKEWIGRTLFSAKGKLVTLLKLWWNPPPVEHQSTPPHPDSYHCRRQEYNRSVEDKRMVLFIGSATLH